MVLPPLPDLTTLSHAEKDALIVALWEQVGALMARVAMLEAKLNEPPKTSDNSSVPPSKGPKANREGETKREGPRQGSVGRKGGGRPLSRDPDQIVSAKATACRHCHAALGEDDQLLQSRYDKIDLPPVRPVVTRVERYAGHCSCCGGTTLAPVPNGMDEGTPFSPRIVATALYLRFTHAISYQRLHRLFEPLFGLVISEGALDAMFRRAKPAFDDAVVAILGRLRRSRIVCSDETSVRIDGKTCWNWVFQNDQMVIHVIRKTRGAGVVTEVMDGHRPVIWVSDLYGAQQGHADRWQVCLAHQLRDCQFAIDAGDTIFAPRMKALLLRAVVLARRRKTLAESTRREYRRRLDEDLDAIMALVPENRHGKRLRKRYGKVRFDLFTFLIDPDVPPDNNGSERELRPTATYRKVTGGFRSDWGAELFAGIRSVVGTAARNGIDAYTAIQNTLSGSTASKPG
ncbi:IS66 family transposase [uncultured Methylobacterium sp.]|uniref:IS66 family transposase n=1 Tax=uncultured Methylobacterium sp. TaxID=157278 RepID=UPI0035CBF087